MSPTRRMSHLRRGGYSPCIEKNCEKGFNMQLFIAEKPSLARAIAEVVGVIEKKKTHFLCRNNTAVTWCFGHLLELAPPEAYTGRKEWRLEELPIIPKRWRKQVRSDVKSQFNAIKSLIKSADVLVNAGDPDREGQLLVDEVIERCDPHKTVKRIWLQALDEKNIKKALERMDDDKSYFSLRQSAEARSYADWLVGMNFTRYFTLKANVKGRVISVGRVQTPTLALVVQRDLQIENFKPHDFYIVKAVLKKNTQFQAQFIPNKEFIQKHTSSFDEEKRLINKALAEKISKDISNTHAIVISYSKQKKTEYPPMPYYLATLQKMASSKYKLTAAQTLSIAQSLYEKKLTTYPRTDCPYIAEEQHADAKGILQNLKNAGVFPEMIKKANANLKHRAFNSSKITAHTAIIPTGDTKALSSLSDLERKVYNEIAKAYICLFFEPFIYNSITVLFDINNYVFKATGREILQKGFSEYCGTSAKENILPSLEKGAKVLSLNAIVETKQTTPPPRFTDGTLIEAMSHIHRFITDERAKKILKETDGIGTEATRAQIIETLIKRNYLKRHGKEIISTQFGRQVIAQLPQFIKDPVLTATWERGLKGIEEKKVTFEEFMSKQVEFVKKHIESQYDFFINTASTKEVIGKCSCGGDIVETPKTYKCEKCGKYTFKTIFGKKLTQKQALALLQDKQIEVKGLKSKKSKKFNAKVSLVKDGEKWKTELEF